MSTLPYELGYLARRQLSVILDRESPQGRDWMGLADRMQFTYSTVLALKGERSPTLALLEEWEKAAGPKATLVTLMSLLDSLQCKAAVTILEEEKAKSVERQELKRPQMCNGEDPTSLNMNCLSLQDSSSVKVERECQNGRVCDSHIQTSLHHVRSQKYDVFLSYAEEDGEFAEEMRTRLVTHAKLRVFVPSDGLMPGKVFHEEIADMIKKGCRKTVVILSPDYIRSPWCGYEANLAVVASPDGAKHVLIPVLYKRCDIPAFLAPLYYSDYPRHQDNREECEKYFWQKLYKSLKYEPGVPTPSNSTVPSFNRRTIKDHLDRVSSKWDTVESSSPSYSTSHPRQLYSAPKIPHSGVQQHVHPRPTSQRVSTKKAGATDSSYVTSYPREFDSAPKIPQSGAPLPPPQQHLVRDVHPRPTSQRVPSKAEGTTFISAPKTSEPLPSKQWRFFPPRLRPQMKAKTVSSKEEKKTNLASYYSGFHSKELDSAL